MNNPFSWSINAKRGAIIAPNERLPWPQTIVLGIQHVFAMFGATLLAPLLMGLDSNVAVLMSGVATLVFFMVTRGKVPSFLGSSFAFIGAVSAATAYAGSGPNLNIPLALGGVVLCGLVYVAIGIVVQAVGVSWIEHITPPVVTGTVVAVIGLNLASVPIKTMAFSNFDTWMQLITFVCVACIAVFTAGLLQRMLLLAGLVAATLIYFVLANVLGLGHPIDLGRIATAPWVGIPAFQAPVFTMSAALLIVPVVVILIAENLGHIKAIASITGQNLDSSIGRAFIGDGIATVLSGGVGGAGMTTYAENIGVMAATKVYSTALFTVAGIVAIILGFSPKFGAVVQTIPVPVMGGVSIVVFGLIAIAGARIWVENNVDFSDSRNLLVAAIPLVLGTGDFTLHIGGFALAGLGTATFGAILLNQLLNRRSTTRNSALDEPASLASK
ncbi:uracil-xanthine permease family protein [Pseudomonas sp. RIT-PI-S]|uniref:uracil-xanthine permease family protein n=1 Tax=Pseudomonas sp. RIT-PI-S TaxID=3035295 RepID=UPI0021D8322C|nr:uracil-xanthine permease family protein [Pseudomonas sp. RIT-PI-S]